LGSLEVWSLDSLEVWSLEVWKFGSLEVWKLGSLEEGFQYFLPTHYTPLLVLVILKQLWLGPCAFCKRWRCGCALVPVVALGKTARRSTCSSARCLQVVQALWQGQPWAATWCGKPYYRKTEKPEGKATRPVLCSALQYLDFPSKLRPLGTTTTLAWTWGLVRMQFRSAASRRPSLHSGWWLGNKLGAEYNWSYAPGFLSQESISVDYANPFPNYMPTRIARDQNILIRGHGFFK